MLYGMLLIDKITYIYKNMNNVINKFLLAGDTYMPEMHLDNLDLFITLAVLLLDIKKE